MPKIILDAMGVIFHEEDDLAAFMPYLEENAVIGCKGSKRPSIKSAYLRLSKGEIDSTQFFRQIGILQPDLDFLLNVSLDKAFLDFAKEHPNLAVLSNDSQQWANYRNQR